MRIPCQAIAICALIFSSCTTRELSPVQRQTVFTIDTLRDGGIIVPVPYEEKYSSGSYMRRWDGTAVTQYRFQPPEGGAFPLYLESSVLTFPIPGQALFTRGFTHGYDHFFSDIATGDHRKIVLPGFKGAARLSLLRNSEGEIGAFFLDAREGNHLFVLTMAGRAAATPEDWLPAATECLRTLRKQR